MPATRASHRSIFVQVKTLKVEIGGRNLEVAEALKSPQGLGVSRETQFR
jgi:hypothetical protein